MKIEFPPFPPSASIVILPPSTDLNYFFQIIHLQIHPSKLTSNSLWAQLDDAEIASDDVFEGLKANFSSK